MVPGSCKPDNSFNQTIHVLITELDRDTVAAGIPSQPGYRPVFGDFVPVPAGILVLAGILAGIFPK